MNPDDDRLWPGDIVELTTPAWPDTVLRGPVVERNGTLYVGDQRLNNFGFAVNQTVCVVQRAPRPLYANHPRKFPVRGDVARIDGQPLDTSTWFYNGNEWRGLRCDLAARWPKPVGLILLVDGETSRLVPR